MRRNRTPPTHLIVAAFAAFLIGVFFLASDDAAGKPYPHQACKRSATKQQPKTHDGWRIRYHRCTGKREKTMTNRQAVRWVFGKHWRAAWRVARCESDAQLPVRVQRWRRKGRWARDYASGTHWGIYQMGGPERATHGRYGFGTRSIVQVRSAHSLWKRSGWRPWRSSRRCHGQ